MDDAVLGLVWVTSVCIAGHIASAFYFQKVLKDESHHIDEKINEIDLGIASIAQWMIEKFEKSPAQEGFIDWGAIINQLFSQNNSPNNLNNPQIDEQAYGASTYEAEVIETEKE